MFQVLPSESVHLTKMVLKQYTKMCVYRKSTITMRLDPDLQGQAIVNYILF